jgi:cell wall-associated NlpC family hydrolase
VALASPVVGTGAAMAGTPMAQSSGHASKQASSQPTPTPSTAGHTRHQPRFVVGTRAHRVVTRDSQVQVWARLTRDGHGVARAHLRYYRHALHGSSWHYAGRARTRHDGWARLPWTAYHHRNFKVRYVRTGAEPVVSRVQHIRLRSLGDSAMRIARTRRGDPYSYGADGPHRFDCSGFTRYVFGRLGHSLAHNSGAQYGEVRHISKSHARIGDLIFFGSSGSIYHVGIYAGHGRIWHAPHSGDHVRLQAIWTSSYVVGRV